MTRVVALSQSPILRISGVVNLIDRVRTVEFALICIIGAQNVIWCASATFASQIIARQAVFAARLLAGIIHSSQASTTSTLALY